MKNIVINTVEFFLNLLDKFDVNSRLDCEHRNIQGDYCDDCEKIIV